MTGVKPSGSADPPPSCTFTPAESASLVEEIFLLTNPFPHEFDRTRIMEWLQKAKDRNISFRDIGGLVRGAGHTDPIRLQCIQVLIAAVGLPPPPFL